MKESGEVREDLIDILEDLDERLGEINTDVRHSDEPLSRSINPKAKENEKNENSDSPGYTGKD